MNSYLHTELFETVFVDSFIYVFNSTVCYHFWANRSQSKSFLMNLTSPNSTIAYVPNMEVIKALSFPPSQMILRGGMTPTGGGRMKTMRQQMSTRR